jgi:hypothetical protein
MHNAECERFAECTDYRDRIVSKVKVNVIVQHLLWCINLILQQGHRAVWHGMGVIAHPVCGESPEHDGCALSRRFDSGEVSEECARPTLEQGLAPCFPELLGLGCGHAVCHLFAAGDHTLL